MDDEQRNSRAEDGKWFPYRLSTCPSELTSFISVYEGNSPEWTKETGNKLTSHVERRCHPGVSGTGGWLKSEPKFYRLLLATLLNLFTSVSPFLHSGISLLAAVFAKVFLCPSDEPLLGYSIACDKPYKIYITSRSAFDFSGSIKENLDTSTYLSAGTPSKGAGHEF